MIVGRADATSGRFTGAERVAVDVEGSSVGLPAGSAERVDRLTDADVDESQLLEDRLPARPGQPADQSGVPEIDIRHRLRRQGATIGDVR